MTDNFIKLPQFRGFYMKNVVPKIIVIISAIVLWFLIVSGQKYVGVIDVPLKIYEPRDNKTLAEDLPETVKLRVEGNGRNLYFQRWSKKSQLILDVGAISGSQSISLKEYFSERENQVRLMDDMQFLEIVYPDSIRIEIDEKINKTVPIEVHSDISLKPGFILVDKHKEYALEISGPEKLLRDIHKLATKDYQRDNVDIAFSEELEIINPFPKLMQLSQDVLEVEFEVEMIGERSIMNIPITVKNQPDDLEIQFLPKTVSLRITGGNSQIQSLTEDDFTVYFDYLTQWFPNRNYYPVKVKTPETVLDVIDSSPKQVEVIVLKKQIPELRVN